MTATCKGSANAAVVVGASDNGPGPSVDDVGKALDWWAARAVQTDAEVHRLELEDRRYVPGSCVLVAGDVAKRVCTTGVLLWWSRSVILRIDNLLSLASFGYRCIHEACLRGTVRRWCDTAEKIGPT